MAVQLATRIPSFTLLFALLGLATPRIVEAAPRPAAAKKKVSSSKASRSSTSRKGKATARTSNKRRRVFVEQRVPWMRGNQPNVQSIGALVVDLDTGEELFARKPDQPRAIASISKLAAMLVVMDRKVDLDGLTTMSKIDLDVARGGAASRLPEGMTLTNRDLLHAAMLGSDNRAVSALGRAVGLNATQFAEAMNRKVAELGLKHTRFREPTGLSPENVSTPRELVTLLKAAMAHPVLGPIMRRPEYDAHPVSRPAIRYVNTHKPAWRSNTQVLGGKTGYNDSARYCLILGARVDGRRYAMALLGTEGKMTRFGDVARVSDWIAVHKPARKAPGDTMLAQTAGPASQAATPVLADAPAGPTLPPGAVVPAAVGASPPAAPGGSPPDAGAPAPL